MTDFAAMRKAYLDAIGYEDINDIKEENARLRHELETLQARFSMVILSLQDAIDGVLRVAREGKSDT